jgi:hypothetical protein
LKGRVFDFLTNLCYTSGDGKVMVNFGETNINCHHCISLISSLMDFLDANDVLGARTYAAAILSHLKDEHI